MRRSHGLLYALIGLMVTFWAGNFIVGKLALREFPALLLVGLRATLAAVFILPVYLWEGRTRPDRWTRADVPLLVTLGMLGVGLNQFFFLVGLSRTSAAHGAIIAGMGPLLVLLIARVAGLERLSGRRAAGMILALVGVAVLKAFEPKTGSQGPTWAGDFLIFLGSLAFALFTVFGKRVATQHSSVTLNTFAYAASAVALMPLTIWQARDFAFPAVSAGAWASLVYMALFPSVIAYLIFYHALSRIPASRVSAFSYVQPLLVTVMGVVVLGEHVTASLVLGGTVIFSGVWMTERG
ncbi:MAG TPA: DMT family transporter [Bryobacteraceae bacterium]|nr:DMT family transporter [Bryobacteraceae bacterium]